MEEQKFRRIMDSVAKTASEDLIEMEVFVSDGEYPLYLTILMKLPERRIMDCHLETFRKNSVGRPEFYLEDLSVLKGVEANAGYLKNIRSALKEKEVPEPLFDAMIETARMSFQIATFKPEEVEGIDITDPVAVTGLDVLRKALMKKLQ